VIRLLYNLLWPIGLLIVLPGYLRKMFRRGNYRRKFGQRFAIYDREVRERLNMQPTIWLHAVSVGEVAVALKLARAIRTFRSEARFALTTTTTTGFGFAEKNAPPEIEVLYSPLDFWPITRRAFSVIGPERIILVEAEVWPNLMAEARDRKIPVALVNARLSPRSEQRFRRFRGIVSPLFRMLDLVGVPEQADADKWIALGVDRDRIRYTGSVKFDPAESELSDRQSNPVGNRLPAGPDHLVLFGGSTHRGEEEVLARLFLRLRGQIAGLRLFLAPRHVERAGEVRRQLENLSLGVRLCSEAEDQWDSGTDCLVLDRTGELRKWYAIASVVFIGKSLTATGGQNPVEPIAAGKPVVFGPHMQNFAALARELVASGGAIQVADEAALETAVERLLTDPEARKRMVESARGVITAHRGATLRTAELVLNLTKRL
jgi:3-deoxy-D-manno-octulosonic-acid transferase